MEDVQMLGQSDFNQLFYRPPNFCEDCGELLDFEVIEGSNVICQKCGGEVDVNIIEQHELKTTDKYAFSKEWKNRLQNIQDKFKTKQQLKRQIVKETCPECGNKKMYFYTLQTRSADEGSTVFYECVKCGYTKKENN